MTTKLTAADRRALIVAARLLEANADCLRTSCAIPDRRVGRPLTWSWPERRDLDAYTCEVKAAASLREMAARNALAKWRKAARGMR